MHVCSEFSNARRLACKARTSVITRQRTLMLGTDDADAEGTAISKGGALSLFTIYTTLVARYISS